MENLLNPSEHGNKKRIGRQKRLSTHIDMTPMVDLAFLLVTFFILTTVMTKPKAKQIILPDEGHFTVWRDSETVNLLLGAHGIFYYAGNDLAAHQKIAWSKIPEFLAKKNQQILALQHKNGWEENGAMTMIKPTDSCNYNDLVNILDELTIANITKYAIVDATQEEVVALRE